MPRNALALRIPLKDDPVIETVGDPDAFDDQDCSIYAVDPDDDDTLYVIDQEYCFFSTTSEHKYPPGQLHCCACGMAHPSIRNACGQR